MARIPEAYIRSYEDLTQKIQSLPLITLEQLQSYYDIISETYSRQVLADRILAYINEP